MTHSVHPYSHRLGIIRDWKSRWFGARGKYQEYLKTDITLRDYLDKRLRGLYVDSIDMERGEKLYRIIIKTSRPGMVIGRSGEGATKIKEDILKKMRKIKVSIPEVKVDVEEVKDPEAHSGIVAYMVAEALEKRMPFRRIMKQTVEKVMANKKVKGVRINLSGRLGGAEMSRRETIKRGQIPLQTLRADVDFAREKAFLPYGVIGVKVWIYRGEIFEDNK
ncbi:MAG TPA: 30S ribosomal protein S3 [Candidatus Paceibacterota bacterium]|jgi:small subunit ribosomal protein S3|nr:ribosomal protein [Patescibacteria group bacterium]